MVSTRVVVYASFPIISNYIGNRSGVRSKGGVFKQSVSDGLPTKNPNSPDGSVSTCIVCGSVYHWARVCPYSYENIMRNQNKFVDSSITLYSDTVKEFVGKTLSTAVLDTGCTKMSVVIHG